MGPYTGREERGEEKELSKNGRRKGFRRKGGEEGGYRVTHPSAKSNSFWTSDSSLYLAQLRPHNS